MWTELIRFRLISCSAAVTREVGLDWYLVYVALSPYTWSRFRELGSTPRKHREQACEHSETCG